MDSMPTTNKAAGPDPVSTENKVLETGAAAIQNFAPVNQICAHLNAFHAYADEPGRCVEANHYCSHLNEDVRQCILYDSPTQPARLIGIEYMISERLFKTLDAEEQKLWHSHVFEVKSGMLIMPKPSAVPEAVWEKAENKEMEQVVHLYGKVYHLWQVDRGDKLPLGEPKLMTSFTDYSQVGGEEAYGKLVDERDQKFGNEWRKKREIRQYIEEPGIIGEADHTWKKT